MKKITSGLLAFALTVLVGCAGTSTPAGVGVWNIEMNTPLGAMPATLTMNEDGSGSMAADGMGSAPVSGITYDGNSVAFSAAIDAQGQSINLDFTGTVDGDSLSGEFGSDFGAFGVTGTRQ